MTKEEKIVNFMYKNDAFSQWLGIEIKMVQKGYCHLEMEVKPEMLNGFSISHGGISYSLADSALAFAANSHGQHALSIETSISHLKAVKAGDTLVAKTTEKSFQARIAIYEVEITNQNEEKVALFKGTVYRKKTLFEV